MSHLFLANGGPGGTNLDPLYDTVLFWILAVMSVSAAVGLGRGGKRQYDSGYR